MVRVLPLAVQLLASWGVKLVRLGTFSTARGSCTSPSPMVRASGLYALSDHVVPQLQHGSHFRY
jgi:hypothetical protein